MEEEFKLTEKERLSYVLQLMILEKLDPMDETYKNQRIALEEGFSYHYSDLKETFLRRELSVEACKLVLNILDMYRGLIFSANLLKWENKDSVKFPGFDSNHSLEVKMYSYAEYFMDDLGRYIEIKELSCGEYNSHREMLAKYKRMLEVWNDIPYNERFNMTEIQMNKTLNA